VVKQRFIIYYIDINLEKWRFVYMGYPSYF